ncbi:hypothetical protein [Microbacterium oleivorans]|uniref:hypothetical protein n=1 Tax=Microbacterium oleivorans TaxID=273677 RepID=UPI00114700B6|nr:hypothetical protein [Microbacterium oleivorans]
MPQVVLPVSAARGTKKKKGTGSKPVPCHILFFDDDAQSVARHLVERDPNMVAFVWKEGQFPGGNESDGSVDMTRIGESNVPLLAAWKNLALEQFEKGLRASSDRLADSEQIAVGHSWGLTPIVTVEGHVHFDEVHSLAGAGLPSNWQPDPATAYHHCSYFDVLGAARSAGIVRVEDSFFETAFDSHVYLRADEPGAWVFPEIGDRLMGNHDLIAADVPDNRRMLRNLQQAITDGGAER